MSINKILTSQYQDLSQEEIANLQYTLGPVIGGGLEGYWRPEVSQLGNITWTWSNASTATPPAGMNIKGDKGDPGKDGTNGKRPILQINSENAHWEWKYYGDTTPWIDLGVVASGEQGPKGEDGYSIDLQSISAGQGGNLITLQWGDPTDLSTSSFFLPSGAAGTDGVSPTITTNELSPTEQHPQGGTAVTITDGTGSETINIWNGNNGAGATVRLLEGTGIKIDANGTDYTVSVSANYALKSELPDLTDYATKTYANDASAYALSEAKTWVNQKNFATSAGLTADKQYAMTTNGWTDFVIPSTSGYLPLSGGTVSGQLEVHGGSNFDWQFIKLTREGNSCGARIGLGNDITNGTLALKTFNAQGQNTVQVNVKYNSNNNELIQVQKEGNTVGNLIPAKIHQGSYTPSSDDGILHIILES